jgi:hypothetical protein
MHRVLAVAFALFLPAAAVTLLPAAAVTLLPAAAGAADIKTTLLHDAPDSNLGDNICDSDPDVPNLPDATVMGGELGQCTLRAAVQQANATAGADKIILRGNPYQLALAGAGEDAAATGDLDITSEIEIVGKGYQQSFVDAKKLKDRIFDVHPGAELTLSGTSLLNGKTAKDDFDPGAPGEVSGGCLRTAGDATLSQVFFFRCTSSDDGGCVSVLDGDLDLSFAIFHSCRAKNEGGALEVGAAADGVSLVRAAAGLCRAGTGSVIAAHSAIDLRNATLAGNRAKLGGAVTVLDGAAATIRNSTLTGNGALNLDASGGTMTVANTILADANADCLGAVTSGGGNLESGTSCGFASTNDQQSQDPLLSPLAFNGGSVPTRALTATSPAIDHGIDGASCEATDARNIARVDAPTVGVAVCDAGAFEFVPPPAP